jgi:hypothetical protein
MRVRFVWVVLVIPRQTERLSGLEHHPIEPGCCQGPVCSRSQFGDVSREKQVEGGHIHDRIPLAKWGPGR